jgi:hypothetical protein
MAGLGNSFCNQNVFELVALLCLKEKVTENAEEE